MNTLSNDLNEEGLVSDALTRVKDDLAAVRPESFAQVNLEVKQMVATIIGTLPEVRSLRERFVKELPAFNIAEFDKLEDYAWALSYAQTLYLTATTPVGDLEALNTEGIKLRERLLADATSLSKHGLLDSSPLAELKGINGYKNVAQDMQILATVLQVAWPQVSGKIPTQAEELVTALRISARLTRIVGLREQGPVQVAAAAEQRVRAFTLTLRVYEDVRRAIGYLRAREADADTIAPSLFTGKAKFPKKGEEKKDEALQGVAGPTQGAPPVITSAGAVATGASGPGGLTGAASADVGAHGPFMS